MGSMNMRKAIAQSLLKTRLKLREAEISDINDNNSNDGEDQPSSVREKLRRHSPLKVQLQAMRDKAMAMRAQQDLDNSNREKHLEAMRRLKYRIQCKDSFNWEASDIEDNAVDESDVYVSSE